MAATRRFYPSDLSDAAWALLEPPTLVAVPRRGMVNAILYVLENDLQWQTLPHGSTVYPYFRKGQKEGVEWAGWPRVRKGFVDWAYRGLRGLGLAL